MAILIGQLSSGHRFCRISPLAQGCLCWAGSLVPREPLVISVPSPAPCKSKFEKALLGQSCISLKAESRAMSQKCKAIGEGVMLYWICVKDMNHPAIAWELSPWQHVLDVSEGPCQWERSS